MKLKRILAFALAIAMVLGTMSFSAFAAEPAERTISLVPSVEADENGELIVQTGEKFTIEVKVQGVQSKGARWVFDYNDDYFTLDKFEVDSRYTMMNTDLKAPEIIAVHGKIAEGTVATYYFTAKKKYVKDEPFDFTDVEIKTSGEAWESTDVSGVTTEVNTDITVDLRKFSNIRAWYGGLATDGDASAGFTAGSTYDNTEKTVAVTTDDIIDEDGTITYSIEGVDGESTNVPKFKDAGTYVVNYKLSKEGYLDAEGKITVTIDKADITNPALHFDTEDITADIVNSIYSYTFDDAEHVFSINSADTVGDCDYEVVYTGGETQTAAGLPQFKNVGNYVVTYTITAENHDELTGELTVSIKAASFEEPTLKLDGNAASEEDLEFDYDGTEHKFEVETTSPTGAVPEIKYEIKKDGVVIQASSTTIPEITEAGDYEITYTITADNHATITETIEIKITNAKFEQETITFAGKDVDFATKKVEYNYDGEGHALVVDAVSPAGATPTITYTVEYENGTVGIPTTTAPEFKDEGTYKVKYTIEATHHTTVSGEVTVVITEPEILVEVLLGQNTDYISMDKMILVYTNASNVSFEYKGKQMYDVSGGKYKHETDTRPFQYVFAIVDDAIMEGTLEQYKANVKPDYADANNSNYVINYDIKDNEEYDYDINLDTEINMWDLVTEYAVIEQDSELYPAQMKAIIRADVDFSKQANSDDANILIEKLYPDFETAN